MTSSDAWECSSDPSASRSYSSAWSSSLGSASNIFMYSRSDSVTPDVKINWDMKSIFDILWRTGIPGPHLLRATKEFTLGMGKGSQGYVWAACDLFASARDSISHDPDGRLQRSLDGWTACVIKRVRSDGKQDLRQQVRSTYSEVIRLCHNDLRNHENIVKLIGWGLCLDSLETVTAEDPRLPLLILERAHCDLGMFLDDSNSEKTSIVVLRQICLAIGRGLGAVHAAGFAHGDLKPANVLMFAAKKEKTWSMQRWIPKLCDFGSSNVKQYLGSPGWQPPEYYEQDKDNVLESLQPCDVFAFGVLAAALYVGRSSSPLDDFGNLDRDEIRQRCQRQCFLHQAVSAVRHRWAAIITEYLGPSNRNDLDHDHHRYLDMITDERNRYFAVLRSSMNYHQSSREAQPWRYMNSARFPIIGPPVDDLDGDINLMSEARLPFRLQESWRSPRKSSILEQILAIFPTQLAATLPNVKHVQERINLWQQKLWKWFLLLLQSKSNRQITIESILAIIESHAHIGWDDSEISTFAHSDEPHICYVYTLLNAIHEAESHPTIFDPLSLRYARARLRSRFSIGCWQKANVSENFLSEYLHSSFPYDIAPLAWLCRGDVGMHELLRLGENTELLWSCTNDSRLSDTFKSEAFLLFFERGCNIAQNIGPDERTAFQRYLESLNDDKEAIVICEHFKRISECENIAPWTRFFLTGQPSDLIDDPEVETQAFSTTALHDAVRVSNYEVVEYLVRTNFVVEAQDTFGETALDLIFNLRNPRNRILNNRILALLRQRRTKPTANSNRESHIRHPELPIGWEVSIAENGSKIYQETSIGSNIDALTFEQPSAGLLDDKRLVIGERKVKGLGQPYFLDPLRFMSSRVEAADDMYEELRRSQHLSPDRTRQELARKKFADRPRIAKEPHYDDVWYHHEAEATASLKLVNPLYDDRVGVRYFVRMLFITRQILLSNYLNVLLLFIPLSIVAQKLDWSMVARVAFSVLAIGPLAANIVLATKELSKKLPSTPLNQRFVVVLSSCSPEVFIEVSAVVRGGVNLMKSVIIGDILFTYLLLGICVTISGLFHREQNLYYTPAGIMAHLGVIPIIFEIILSLFYTMRIDSAPFEVIAGVLFLSRIAAIISLILWFGFLCFRYVSHRELFFEEEGEQLNEELHDTFLDPVAALVLLIVSALLLAICCDNLAQIVLHCSERQTRLLGLLLVPAATKCWTHVPSVQQAMRNRLDYTLDWTVGAGLYTTLCIGPCLVVLGWIIGVPIDLRFGLRETISYGVAIWGINIIIARRLVNYLNGIIIITLISLIIFSFVIYSP